MKGSPDESSCRRRFEGAALAVGAASLRVAVACFFAGAARAAGLARRTGLAI